MSSKFTKELTQAISAGRMKSASVGSDTLIGPVDVKLPSVEQGFVDLTVIEYELLFGTPFIVEVIPQEVS
jgi:hypothetical protein